MTPPSDVTDFVVAGRGEFPTDMLRYDECWPANAESALAIHLRGRRVATFRTLRSLNVHPKRWASFGWEVRKIDSERYGDITDMVQEG